MSERVLREEIEQVSHEVREARRELERLDAPGVGAAEVEKLRGRRAQLLAQRDALLAQRDSAKARLGSLQDERDGLERRLGRARRDVERLTPAPPPALDAPAGSLSDTLPWLKWVRAVAILLWVMVVALRECG